MAESQEKTGAALLQDTLARYEAILASTLDPVITIDAYGTVQAASDSVERVFGWKPHELTGRNISVLMPEPHRSRHDGYLAAYRGTGVTGILGRPREFDALHRDGRTVPVEISVNRVDVPGQEQPLFTGILRDVSEQRRAEAALQESEHRFRNMLETAGVAVVMLDRRGRVTFCNDYLLALTGRTREEVLERNWFAAFVPDEQRDRVERLFHAALADERIEPHFENDILTSSGERRRIAWANAVQRDVQGRLVGATALGVDVTEQRRAERELAEHHERLEELVAERTAELEASHEQLRQADRLASIGTLAAGLGHDMNNVLLPIRCRLDAMTAGKLPGELRRHFEEIRKSVQYLQQLADGLHLLALDPEDAEASTEGTDIADWWEQVGPLLRRALPRHVRLATSLPTKLPRIAVPPHRLTQAVLNLVVNAGEAVGEDGKVRIWAAALPDSRFVRVGVSDNGCGMSPQVKRRALDPFFTTKRRGLGTGLGLSLVHGVARAAAGRLDIESEAGRGTTIVLTLPAQHEAAPAPAVAADGSRRLRAAVSLSDARLASFVSMMLSGAGFGVTTDGAAGDLWVTDTAAGSPEAARRLRDAGARVVVLGRAPEEWRRVGAMVVEDPTDFEALRDRLREALSQRAGAPIT